MEEMIGDLCELNVNKRKFQDEIHDLRKKIKSHDDDNHSQDPSEKDSNSFSEDADSIMSVSNDLDLQNSTSSVNWTANNNSFNTPDYPTFEEEQFDCCEFSSLEYEIKQPEELEELFCSNPNQFILSSGRWNVNQETEQGTEKLTIDKEFEQYFSMLML